ncbi:MAG TPA: PQQ-dependent catabolism-associated CXXCW motif protein [Stellaceae bacterium]|nr:PQQ-dependent catabolism-associated CXXCW motif protein [Stellaceae bacterium]
MIARIMIAGLVALGSPSLAATVPEPSGYRLDDYRAPVPATVEGGTVIHTKGLQALIGRRHVVLIDVLPAPRRPEGMRPDQPWLPVPRRDIPGSLWLPDVGRGALAPELARWFQESLARATAEDKNRILVFYCLSQCWMSWNATKRAARWGYRHVYWYPDGSDGWAKAGLPVAEIRPEPYPDQSRP